MDLFKNFADIKAVQKLEQLARTPYNLAASTALSPERLAAYRVSSCGFDFLYGTQGSMRRLCRPCRSLPIKLGWLNSSRP